MCYLLYKYFISKMNTFPPTIRTWWLRRPDQYTCASCRRVLCLVCDHHRGIVSEGVPHLSSRNEYEQRRSRPVRLSAQTPTCKCTTNLQGWVQRRLFATSPIASVLLAPKSHSFPKATACTALALCRPAWHTRGVPC